MIYFTGIFLSYLFLILWLGYGIKRVPDIKYKSHPPKTSFSIIIPFRNEAEHLPDLLRSLTKITYPESLFEVIFIDDYSDDNSAMLVNEYRNKNENYNIHLLKNNSVSNAPKKDAIETAMKVASYDWIITTDADCILPKLWLSLFDILIQESNPGFIIAPVSYSITNGFLANFQLLDFYSLQAATLGGYGHNHPFLCNGANLAYKKELFNAVSGFSDNRHITSGDDIFLMEKVRRTYPKTIAYLKNKDAAVCTSPENTWMDLFQQRSRWAAKTASNPNLFNKGIGLIVFLTNAAFIIAIILTIFGKISIHFMLIGTFLKWLIDGVFLKQILQFFNQKISVAYYLCSSLIYPFFVCIVVVRNILFKFKWKNRVYNK